MHGWFCFFCEVSAQNEPHFFDEMRGLPSSEVYGTIQDNRGVMWIATAEGLARYDGRDMQVYTTKDGLSTNFNWRLHKDKSDRIWLGNHLSPFTYIKNDSVYRVGESYPKFNFANFEEDQEGNVYIISKTEKKTYKVDLNDNVTTIDSILLMVTVGNQKVWEVYDSLPKSTGYLKASNKHYAFLLSDSLGNSVVVYDSNKNQIKKLLLDFKGGKNLQFVGDDLYYGGFETFDKCSPSRSFNVEEVKNSFEKEFHPLSVFIDNNGNSWFADPSSGLRFYESLPEGISYTSFPISLKASKCFHWAENEYAIGFANQEFFLKLGDSIYWDSLVGTQILAYNGVDFKITPSAKMVFLECPTGSSDTLVNWWPEYGDRIQLSENQGVDIALGGIKTWAYYHDAIYFGTSNGGYVIEQDENQVTVAKIAPGYVYAIAKNKETLWVGNANGLRVKNADGEWVELLDKSITYIANWKEAMVVMTEDGELFYFDPEKLDIAFQTSQYSNFQGLQIFEEKLFLFGEEELLIFSDTKDEVPDVIRNGLAAGKVIHLVRLEDNYRLISELGYYDFENLGDWINFKQEEKFIVQTVQVNNGEYINGQVDLHDKDNFVGIKLAALQFPDNSDLSFKYRLNDGNWIQSVANEVMIFNIPFGEHVLEFKAVRNDGSNYGESIQMEISNPQPFYESNWFYLGLFVLASSVLMLFLYRRQQRKVQLMKLSFETMQNRQKMLIMQMKPHFLSNLFNSLQAGIANNEVEKNSVLLSMADRYLRKTLKTSQENVILLKDEISFVSDYVELERTRFTIPIEFELSKQIDHLSNVVRLPVFILQPLVENALWHGIHKSKEVTQGRISIDIEESEDYYLISVTDNGVGFGKSGHIGNSISLVNINERLMLLDSQKREKYYQFIEVEQGTKVIIYVTKKIKDYSY